LWRLDVLYHFPPPPQAICKLPATNRLASNLFGTQSIVVEGEDGVKIICLQNIMIVHLAPIGGHYAGIVPGFSISFTVRTSASWLTL
jgi:hypothetical protein